MEFSTPTFRNFRPTMSKNLYIDGDRIYAYPRDPHWFWGLQVKDLTVSQSDLNAYRRKDLASYGAGDIIYKSQIKPKFMQYIYKGFEPKQMSNEEAFIHIMLFAMGEFESDFNVVTKLVSFRGNGQSGQTVTQDFLLTEPDEKGKKPILTPLTRSSGSPVRRLSLSELENSYNINAWASASLAVINGFGKGMMFILDIVGPASKAKATKEVSQWMLKKASSKLMRFMSKKVAEWTAQFVGKLAIDIPKAIFKELHASAQKEQRKALTGVKPDPQRVRIHVDKAVRDTLLSAISGALAGLILDPVKDFLPKDAERSMTEKISTYLSMKLIDRVVNMTTEVMVNLIGQVPPNGTPDDYQKRLGAKIQDSGTKALENPIGDILKDVIENMIKDGF